MSFLHGKPQTRRDFLAASAKGFVSCALAPSLVSVMIRASRCEAADAVAPIPFLVFDLAGGAALPGNFLVGNKGGPKDLLKSYDTLGWNPRASGALDEQFGLPMSAKASKILAGITASASAGARAGLRISSICHFGQDDTSANVLSAVTLVSRANAPGKIIPSATGIEPTPSGGNSGAIQSEGKYNPLTVGALEDLVGALSLTGELNKLTPSTTNVFKRMLSRLSESQLSALGDAPIATAYRATQSEFSSKLGNSEFAKLLDPRKNADIAPIFGLNERTAGNAEMAIRAGIMMNAIQGNTGAGVISLGGYDYHVGNQTEGDTADQRAGVAIGQAIETAFRLKKPLFFQIITDGGISATTGTRNWDADSGIRSMTIMGYFDPSAAPKQHRIQVGNYVDGQGADLTTLVGQDRLKAGYAVFANYLAVSGRLGEFDSLATRGIFSTSELDSVVCYG